MKKFSIPLVACLVVSFAFITIYASGATTISTNINTGGTLTVSGATTLGTGTGFAYLTSGLVSASSTIATGSFETTGDWTGTFDGYNGPAMQMSTTSVASITTLSNLVTVGTIVTGVWQGTAIADGFLTKTGDWTGTFDGYNGPAMQMSTTSVASITTLSNLATVGTITTGVWNGTSIADADIDDDITASNYLSLTGWYATTTDGLTEGSSNLYMTQDGWAGYLAGTTTDALDEGSSNFYATQSRWDTFWSASTTLDSVTSIPNLVTVGANVGIGTTTPSTEISALGTATTTLYLHSDTASTGGCIQLEGANDTVYRAYATTTGPLILEEGACK